LPGYTLQAVDVGLMIGLRVRGATNGGAVTLDAAEVGPIVPGAPPSRGRR
jgi:hypothetical protein